MTAPLYLDPVIGWRVWHVAPGPEGPRLLSWSRPSSWPAGERMQAACRTAFGRHQPPRRGHRCGVYALRRRDDAEGLLRDLFRLAPPGSGRRATAIGRVSLWGRLIENVDGWRAEYAYPYDVTLFGATEELSRELAARYAIDVRLANAQNSGPTSCSPTSSPNST